MAAQGAQGQGEGTNEDERAERRVRELANASGVDVQAQVEAYRATPVGAHALKVYEHR